MTHIHMNPDTLVAGIKAPAYVEPCYSLARLAADPAVTIGPARIEVAADRLGLHLDLDGSGWLTIGAATDELAASVTLLSLDDDEGRAAALAVLPLAAADCARGLFGTVRITVAPVADRHVIIGAVYVSALGIEVTA